jgi:hypothetical protein
LAPVYGWFTEGFDTRDLKEAKALLEELASHGPASAIEALSDQIVAHAAIKSDGDVAGTAAKTQLL